MLSIQAGCKIYLLAKPNKDPSTQNPKNNPAPTAVHLPFLHKIETRCQHHPGRHSIAKARPLGF
jgi:hypothetical protein